MKKLFFIFIISFLLNYYAISFAQTVDVSKAPTKSFQSYKVDNFLGAASSNLPITVPPGRKGIQPNLNIIYSSITGNGIFGVGWSMELGYIERSTKNAIPKYTSSDKFDIALLGINSELEVNSDSTPNEFFPKVTPAFIKIIFRDPYWEVYDKDGKKYIFGQTSDSRLETPNGTFRWNLNKIIDTCGNYLTIIYTKDGYQVYPSKIEYTGNQITSESPVNKVEFIYESRTDILSSFKSGTNVVTNKRLKEIKAYASGSLANRYLFEYAYSSLSKRSTLTKFTQFGTDGTSSLPSIKFTYQDVSSNNYAVTKVNQVSNDHSWKMRYWCDTNSTGIDPYLAASGTLFPDGTFSENPNFKISWGGTGFYWAGTTNDLGKLLADGQNIGTLTVTPKGSININARKKIAFELKTNLYVDTPTNITIPVISNCNAHYFLNGDYTTAYDFSTPMALKEGANFIEITGYTQDENFNFNLNFALSDAVTRMQLAQFVIPQLCADFNSDGIPDLATVFNEFNCIRFSMSNGEEFIDTSTYGPLVLYGAGPELLLGDFGGGGLTGILVMSKNSGGEMKTPLKTGAGKITYQSEGFTFNPPESNGNHFVADCNGDGKTDIGIQADNTNNIIISLTPEHDFAPIVSYWLYNFPGKILIGDFNGDAMTDIASFDSAQNKVSVALNKGNAFDTPVAWLSNFIPGTDVSAADCNGDGLTDVIYYDITNGQVMAALSDGTKFGTPQVFMSGFSLKDAKTAIQSADFNGDGICDFYVFNADTLKSEIGLSSSGFPDLLTKIDNGTGGALSIKYGSTKNIKSLDNSGYATMPFVISVVTETSSDDGMGNVVKTTYDYSGGYYDFTPTEREFRGFNKITAIDSSGNQKETFFKQDSAFKGKPYLENYKDPLGNLYLKIATEWRNILYYQGSFVYAWQQSKDTYDGNSDFKNSYVSNYSFDLGELVDSCSGATNETKFFNHTDYVRAEGDGILSRPKYTYSGQDTKKQFYYDDDTTGNAHPVKGLLTQEKKWVIISNQESPEISDANTLITKYTYDTYGNILTVTDPEGHVTTNTYDATYHTYLTQKKNALGQIVKSTFDFKTGKILTSIDENNQTTTYNYDVLGRLRAVVGPLDSAQYPSETYEYDLTSCPVKVTRKYKVSYSPVTYAYEYKFYDGMGRLIQTKTQAANNPSSGQARQVVSDVVIFDQQAKIKDKLNPYFTPSSISYSQPPAETPRTSYQYDCMGRIIKTINPDSTYRTLEYSDWTVTKTDENEHKIRSSYDSQNRIIKLEEFNGSEIYATKYLYDPAWRDDTFDKNYVYRKLFRITDDNNNVTSIVSDLAGRKILMSDPDTGLWRYTYDNASNLKSQKDALGRIITFDYDALNRVIKKTYPDSKTITYKYDDTAKQYGITRLSYSVTPDCRSDFYYDSIGRQNKITNTIDGVGYTVEKTYNPLNQALTIKYPDGETINYKYDNASQVNQITGSNNYLTQAEYSASGQFTKISYGNSSVSEFTYAPDNLRLIDLKVNDGLLEDLHYNYDNTGNIKDITDNRNTASQSFLYDNLNRLIQANGSYGNLAYSYDSIGNITNKEGVAFGYDPQKPHALTSGTSGFIASYDANGNMISTNTSILTYNYDNQLSRFEPLLSNENITMQITFKPGWNFFVMPLVVNDNSITSILSGLAGKFDDVARFNPQTSKYEHFVNNPDFNQFTTLETARGYQIYISGSANCTFFITGKSPTTVFNISLTSGWNLVGFPGNIKTKVSSAFEKLVKGSDYSRICAYNKTTGAYADLMDSDYLNPGESYYVKALKNTTWSMLPKASFTDFYYDASGNRVKKLLNDSTATIYLGNLFEKTGTTVTNHIFLGSKRIASKTATQVIYYHTDHLGSTNLVTDSTGAQIQLTEYKPYGSLTRNDVIASPEGAKQSQTNYLFTGKELDSSTSLYYYGARYYNPEIGRFVSPDPINQNFSDPQNLNAYAYCRNNPLNLIDPTGERWQNSWSEYSWDSLNNSWNSFSSLSNFASYNNYSNWQSYSQEFNFPSIGQLSINPIGYALFVHGITSHKSGYAGLLGDTLRNNGVFVKEALWSGKLRDFGAFSQIKNEIINMSQLAEANNQTLTIVSHSWGSMLSGSGLRSSRAKANWVSMGSPYFNFTRPEGVISYANIMAEGDFVGLPSILNLTAKHIGISNSGMYLAIADMHNYWNNPIVASIILEIMGVNRGDQNE